MGLVVFAAKIALTILNTVFAMIAVVMVLLGVLVYYGADIIIVFLDPMLQQLRSNGMPHASLNQAGFDLYSIMGQIAWPMIICGAALFIISFVGCCGANMENRILLIVYAAIVGVVLAAEILAVIVLAGGQDEWKARAMAQADGYIKTEYRGDNSSDAFSVLVNVMQMGLNCCGIENYTDLQVAKNWDREGDVYLSDAGGEGKGPLQIPFSCCVMSKPFPSVSPKDLNCAKTPTAVNSWIEQPCLDKLLSYIMDYDELAGIGAAGFLGVQIAILLLTVLIIMQSGKINPIV